MSPEEKFDAIVRAVCTHYNVPRDVLMGPRTSQAISRARHMSMALCYAMVPEWTIIEIRRRHSPFLSKISRSMFQRELANLEVRQRVREIIMSEKENRQ